MKNDRVLNFKGTHKEIGEKVGLNYKKWGHTYSQMPPFADKFYWRQLKIYEKFWPQYLEFLSGVAKGVGKSKDWVYKFSLTIFLSVAKKIAEKKCSAFVVRNKNGVFVGRNYDWVESSEESSKLLQYEFTDGSSFNLEGISDMGTWQPHVKVNPSNYTLIIEDAWNDKGLYIGLNGAPDRESGLGMTTPHVIQLVAEQCKNVGEASNLLEIIPTTNSQIFTLADKSGNFAVIEKSLKKGAKIRHSSTFIIATNHYNHQDLKVDNSIMFEKVPFHSSFARYHYLESNLIKKWKNLSFSSIIPLMSKPPVLQSWRGETGDIVTNWTLALNLTKGKYQINFAPLLNTGVTISN